jgi:hypothetical protein
MELHPVWFVLLAYAIAAVVAALVAFIVKVISFTVQRKSRAATGDTEKTGEGGGGS